MNRTKTVTRRKGWKFLRPGDEVMGCVKCMGLKPGEKLKRLGLIRITNVRRERLDCITDRDVWLEGFPTMDRWEFIDYFITHMGGSREQEVTRIEFKYL